MKFNVSSSVLSNALQNAARVVSGKNAIPILDYFLFEIQDNLLIITASDSEIVLKQEINIVNESGENGSVAFPPKHLIDSLKELAEQPLTFEISPEDNEIILIWSSGNLKFSCVSSDGYPVVQGLGENFSQITIAAEVLESGLSNTIFAAEQNTQLRPTMQGVLLEIENDRLTFVGTNGQRLAKLEVSIDENYENKTSLIIPAKAVNVLKNLIAKNTGEAVLQFDGTNILFKIDNIIFTSRLIEGNYPRYRQVIPETNDRIAIVDRNAFLSAVKRVSSCSNAVTGLVQLTFTTDKVFLKCQDINFSTYAEDKMSIQYNSESMEIGFRAQYLLEVVSVIDSEEVIIKLADSTRPSLFLPKNQPSGEEFLVLLMPITIN